MARLRKLAMLVVAALAPVWGFQRKGTARTVKAIPERLRGAWYLSPDATANPNEVRAFRLDAQQVVLIDPTTGAELRGYPTRSIAIVTRLDPRRGYAVIYYGKPHPTNIADDRMEVYFDRSDAIFVSQMGGSNAWPDSAKFVRKGS
jgi:hypothetical protein